MNISSEKNMSKLTSTKSLLLAVLVLGLSACAVSPDPRPNDPDFAPVIIPSAIPNQATAGGLYQPGFGMQLFSDIKAHQIGDIITVTLEERTVSTKSSSVDMSKDSEVTFADDVANGTTLLNKTLSLPGNLGLGSILGIDQSRSFNGGSGADQSNSLQGRITVTVADVLANGNLLVRGEKWITLNRGDEFIRISGIIRPQDITPDNTIASQKMANARITYSGTGELAENQHQGWLTRFFSSRYWPF